MLKFTEEPFTFETYIAREDFQREVLENMHWTNGTQSVCNGSWSVCDKDLIWESLSLESFYLRHI